MTHPRREASRVLLIDAADRLLLAGSGGWWFTVGGGIEPGETREAAAVRETAEETGISLDPVQLGPLVFERTAVVPWGAGRVEQHEVFFAVRVVATPLSDAGWTDLERDTLEELRWWSEAELRATEDRLAPANLAELLHEVLAGLPAGRE